MLSFCAITFWRLEVLIIVDMIFFNRSSKKQKNYISFLVSLSKKGIDHFENLYKQLSNASKFEVFMLNMLIGWKYYLERGKIDTSSNSSALLFMNELYKFSQTLNLDIDSEYIVELYKARHEWFSKDIMGMQSNHSKSKLYHPAYSLTAIIYEPLNIYPDMLWDVLISSGSPKITNEDMEKFLEVSVFAPVFAQQFNWV